MKKFVNRHDELKFLNKEYNKKNANLIVIYGRRRIGKTSLIKEFIRDKKSIYFLGTEESERENIKSFQKLSGECIESEILKGDNILSWEDIFTMITEHKKEEKKIIIIDEFQYICRTNKAFPSVFQKIWDNLLSDNNIMVILCGSLISMMEQLTLSYSSPLYGRRTGQIKMKQIKFNYYNEFYNNKTRDELIQLYSITGGVPKYIELFEEMDNVFEAIEENILNKQSFLYEEPVFLLEKEVGEVGSYFSIIKTIAAGNHKLGKIATVLGVNQSKLTKYLSTLINLDILERQVPITESNPEKSKMGLYFIKDNFIEFWFKFVYPYRSYIEIDDIEYVKKRIKDNFIHNHVSFKYEEICLEELWFMSKEDKLPFRIMKAGRWWNNNEEIDIVGINEEENSIIFGECKYLESQVGIDIYYKLKDKSNIVKWSNSQRKEYLMIFSRKGFTKELRELANNSNGKLLLIEG